MKNILKMKFYKINYINYIIKITDTVESSFLHNQYKVTSELVKIIISSSFTIFSFILNIVRKIISKYISRSLQDSFINSSSCKSIKSRVSTSVGSTQTLGGQHSLLHESCLESSHSPCKLINTVLCQARENDFSIFLYSFFSSQCLLGAGI